MKRNKFQNIALHTLIGKLGIDKDTKEQLVLDFTNNRTASSAGMKFTECENLINKLKDMQTVEFSPGQKMRSKIFWYFRKAGYLNNIGKTDQNAVYSWVLKYGYLKKSLKDYTEKELPKLVTQAEQIYLDHLKSTNK